MEKISCEECPKLMRRGSGYYCAEYKLLFMEEDKMDFSKDYNCDKMKIFGRKSAKKHKVKI